MLQPTTSDLSNRPECLASAIMRFSLRWEESWVWIDLIWDCDSTQLLTVIFIFTIMISTEMLKCHLKCKCRSAIWLLGQDCIVDISILHSTTPHQISPILLLLLLLSYNYLLCIKSELSREQIKPSNIILIYNTLHTKRYSILFSGLHFSSRLSHSNSFEAWNCCLSVLRAISNVPLETETLQVGWERKIVWKWVWESRWKLHF